MGHSGNALARVLALCTLCATGCGYSSQYVPLADGRARPVWSDKDVRLWDGGRPLSAECVGNVAWATGTRTLRLLGGDVDMVQPQAPATPVAGPQGGVHFVPVLVGPPILLPPLPPPLPPPGLGPVHHGARAGGAHLPRSSLDSELAKVLTVMAVVALVVLPAVDVALAASHPESGERSSDAIDQANALNDLGRTRGTACTTEWAP